MGRGDALADDNSSAPFGQGGGRHQTTTSSSVLVDLEEARRAIGRWWYVGRLLGKFEVDPGAILNELRHVWRLHRSVTP